MCMQSNVLRHFSIKRRAHFLLTCATICALRCRITDYGPQRARHPCVPTVSVVVREAAERTDRMLGEERNLPAVSSYWRTARNSDSTSDRSDSSLSLSAA